MMKKFISLFCCAALLSLSASLTGQQTISKKTTVGSWLGAINVNTVELRIVFNLSITGRDSLIATMDSPDQGAKGIKLGPVTLSGETIKISAGAMLAEYNGTFKNDSVIDGTWKQRGNTVDLNLKKLKGPFTLNRPQEPKPPFPYSAEEVTFTNESAKIKLAGTLTIPAGKGPFPAVVMITGSGAQNRDEEILGHKPFLIIADYLSRNGIAVLRYDDRGVGKSQGSQLNATSADFATDAVAGFNFLKSQPKINAKYIGLVGHSEGGLIAPMIASENPEIGFIISLAGPGVTGQQIIIRQSEDIGRISGASSAEIHKGSDINKKLYAILRKEKDNKKAESKIVARYREFLEKEKKSKDETDKAVNQLKMTFGAATYTWFRYFIMTDPDKFWKRVKCPVLALNGDKDLQVSANDNLPDISKALKTAGNKNVKIVKLPGLNYLFQHCTSGLPSEYANIEETFSPEVLKIMAEWIVSLK